VSSSYVYEVGPINYFNLDDHERNAVLAAFAAALQQLSSAIVFRVKLDTMSVVVGSDLYDVRYRRYFVEGGQPLEGIHAVGDADALRAAHRANVARGADPDGPAPEDVFEKAGPVIENFLFARYHMFQAVYYHHAIVAFNLLIEKIYELLVKSEVIPHPVEILKSNDESVLAMFDDDYLWQKMLQCSTKKNGDLLSELARMVLTRNPLALAVHEFHTAEKDTKPTGYSKINILKRFQETKKALADKARLPEEWLFPWLAPKVISLLPDESPVLIRRGDQLVSIEADSSSPVSIL
jgi:hypothetical protein